MGTALGILVFTLIAVNVFFDHWPKWIRKHLHMQRSFSVENCYVGDVLTLDWRISNSGKLPLTWLRLDTSFSPSIEFEQAKSAGKEWVEYRSIHYLAPESELKYAFNCCFHKRGYYLFKDVDYRFSDYFGFHTHEGRFSDHASLYVYPSLRPIDALVDRSQQYMGDKEVKRWVVEDPLIHVGSRDYTGAEPMRHIHWNATAQTGKLQVKKFAYTTEISSMLLLNAQTKTHFWEGTEEGLLEQMVETLAAYTSAFEKNNDQYGFASNCPVQEGAGGVMLPVARGRKHYHKVFRALTQITHYTNVTPEHLVRYAVTHNVPSTRMVLVTCYMTEELLAAIQAAVRKGFFFEVITLRAVADEWRSREPKALFYALKEDCHEN